MLKGMPAVTFKYPATGAVTARVTSLYSSIAVHHDHNVDATESSPFISVRVKLIGNSGAEVQEDNAVVVTGSGDCVLAESVAEMLGIMPIINESKEQDTLLLTMANGRSLKAIGYSQPAQVVTEGASVSVQFAVLPDRQCMQPILLGCTWAQRARVVIDCGRGMVFYKAHPATAPLMDLPAAPLPPQVDNLNTLDIFPAGTPPDMQQQVIEPLSESRNCLKTSTANLQTPANAESMKIESGVQPGVCVGREKRQAVRKQIEDWLRDDIAEKVTENNVPGRHGQKTCDLVAPISTPAAAPPTAAARSMASTPAAPGNR